jgi:transposase
MPARALSAHKVRNIITLHALSRPSYRELSRLFDVSSSTVGKYLSAVERSSISLAKIRRLADEALRQLLCPPRLLSRSRRHETLIESFPAIHQCLNSHATTLLEQWRRYRNQRPTGYCYSQFANLYRQWLSTNLLPRPRRNSRPRRNCWAIALSIEDIKTLKEWRLSNNKMRWERAVALQDMHKGCSIASICRKLERSPKTIKRWRRTFLAQGIGNLAIPLKKAVKRQQRNHRHRVLFKLFPSIHRSLSERGTHRIDEWRAYRSQFPNGYGYSQFTNLYAQWLSANQLPKPARTRYAVLLKLEDAIVLKKWRSSSDKRRWERAVALEGLHKSNTMTSICQKLGRSPRTIKKWRQIFLNQGLGSLQIPSKKACNEQRLAIIAKKKERLVKIIHESPSLHGVNRTTWTLETLATAYRSVYGESISRSSVSQYFNEYGYKFKKARSVLTSPDPEYRTKLKQITSILSRLTDQEKFFSIDEFGPCAVKRRGGRALVPGDQIRTIPQRQRSKGSLICTAALELCTNQVTHFYSKRKNTAEMIKMLDILVAKYSDQDRIYLSRDAAPWHASKAFIQKVDALNAQYTESKATSSGPRVELAPLPSGAQFLNVIESVFSGMARAVIHNSDYSSVDECKRAINQYFRERNDAFSKNPRRAGNKIWGKEREKPIFSEANNCKDPRYR